MKNKLCILLITLLSSVLLTACDDVEIFKKEVDPYAIVSQKDKTLENDVFYVKDTTNFNKIYKPEGSASSGTSVLNESRVFAVTEDETLIPTLYNNELLAYSTEKLESFTGVELERFYDCGYSFGFYNGTYLSDEAMIYFDGDKCVIKNSSLGKLLEDTKVVDIRISSIDGKPIDSSMVDPQAGIIVGLEQDKDYKVGYYIGSVYHESSITADTRIYKAFEMFSYDSSYIKDTPNGYMSFQFPQDLKPGYYNVNGQGLVRYYNFSKETSPVGVAVNESYYLDERSKIEAYSRQYNINVPKRVRDLKIMISYSTAYESNNNDSSLFGDADSGLVSGIVFAPDGSRFDMEVDSENSLISLSMDEAMAGDWTVNVIPKSLVINDVTVDSDKAVQEATCEETTISLPENRENIEFISEYTAFNKEAVKETTIYGVVLAEDGKTYEMNVWADETDKNNVKYYISYELAFAKAGSYTVRIYHYPEETAIQPLTVQDKTKTDTEVIIIDE